MEFNIRKAINMETKNFDLDFPDKNLGFHDFKRKAGMLIPAITFICLGTNLILLILIFSGCAGSSGMNPHLYKEPSYSTYNLKKIAFYSIKNFRSF